MVDISQLGNLNSAEPLDLDLYTDSKEVPSLPKAGRYIVRAPESFSETSFSATKAGFLSAQVDPTIVGPTNEGYQLRYIKVSAKPFEKSPGTSQLGLYLKATGLSGTIPGEPQAQADAVASTANRQYQIDVDWEARNPTTGLSVKGMNNFPANGSVDTRQPWVDDENDKDETGRAKRVWAHLSVKRFLPLAV